ncbi:hypothetical protein MA16_Dca001743 [Dendrobium catenatum]|uniref:Glutaredoxin-like protein n=1 Tax=Dendrobium catenatum TaxID=906689 RepID=A0A2I0WN98_9ASPA|nr:hypothetical protein MA16_Dca001743 [Dendrobium catenatum]
MVALRVTVSLPSIAFANSLVRCRPAQRPLFAAFASFSSGGATCGQASPLQRQLVLYTKPGCCLCEGLKEKLQAALSLGGSHSLHSVQLQVSNASPDKFILGNVVDKSCINQEGVMVVVSPNPCLINCVSSPTPSPNALSIENVNVGLALPLFIILKSALFAKLAVNGMDFELAEGDWLDDCDTPMWGAKNDFDVHESMGIYDLNEICVIETGSLKKACF